LLLTLRLEEESLRSIEREVNGIEGVDGRQQCGGRAFAADNEIAHIHAPVRNPSGNGRADVGEFNVEIARAQACLRRGDVSLCRFEARTQLIDLALRNRFVALEAFGARKIRLRKRQRARRRVDSGTGLGLRGLERALTLAGGGPAGADE
jgi:hypothetical protein